MIAPEELLSAYPLQTSSWWALSGVDVLPEKPARVVVALGDSTTDGYGSTVEAKRRYPDILARRFAASQTHTLSILNAGICWNELFAARFPRLVKQLPNVLPGMSWSKLLRQI